MLGDLFSWYVNSLAEFWGFVLRIGLPQILLVILLICWLRRKGCGKKSGKGCCRVWSCGCCGDNSQSSCCVAADGCGCTCGLCCCRKTDQDHPTRRREAARGEKPAGNRTEEDTEQVVEER